MSEKLNVNSGVSLLKIISSCKTQNDTHKVDKTIASKTLLSKRYSSPIPTFHSVPPYESQRMSAGITVKNKYFTWFFCQHSHFWLTSPYCISDQWIEQKILHPAQPTKKSAQILKRISTGNT